MFYRKGSLVSRRRNRKVSVVTVIYNIITRGIVHLKICHRQYGIFICRSFYSGVVNHGAGIECHRSESVGSVEQEIITVVGGGIEHTVAEGEVHNPCTGVSYIDYAVTCVFKPGAHEITRAGTVLRRYEYIGDVGGEDTAYNVHSVERFAVEIIQAQARPCRWLCADV